MTEPVAADAARRIALQMLQERGRGAVLVGVARVDAALERLLQAVLLPTAGRNDSLFQADRPLGSFGARIGLAHRLGLIETPVERALHTLRCVRNAFAHSRGGWLSAGEPGSSTCGALEWCHQVSPGRGRERRTPLRATTSGQQEWGHGLGRSFRELPAPVATALRAAALKRDSHSPWEERGSR